MRTTIFLLVAAALVLAGCDSTTTRSTTSTTTPSSSSASVPSAAGPSDPYADSTTVRKTVTTVEKPVEPDNSAVNERDRDPNAKTPIDQNENQRDVNITADIRKQVLAQDNMSINARNVKIITADGKVTLRGPVNSQEEKNVIDGIAKNVAGKDNVDNQIEVKESN